MGESFDTLNKYFSEYTNTVHYFGNDILVRQLADALYSGAVIEYEAPDIYLKLDNVVWIIEHFEFDCFRSNRKGSSLKREECRIARAEENIIPTEQGVLFHDRITAESSYCDYINNVKRSFKAHYRKIDTYKHNLINARIADENTIFKVIFLIDDASIFGSSCIDDTNNWSPVVLAHSKEFLEILEKVDSVDGILTGTSVDNEKYIWFIDRCQIDEYYKNVEGYDSFRFMNFVPHVLGYTITIPRR